MFIKDVHNVHCWNIRFQSLSKEFCATLLLLNTLPSTCIENDCGIYIRFRSQVGPLTKATASFLTENMLPRWSSVEAYYYSNNIHFAVALLIGISISHLRATFLERALVSHVSESIELSLQLKYAYVTIMSFSLQLFFWASVFFIVLPCHKKLTSMTLKVSYMKRTHIFIVNWAPLFVSSPPWKTRCRAPSAGPAWSDFAATAGP